MSKIEMMNNSIEETYHDDPYIMHFFLANAHIHLDGLFYGMGAAKDIKYFAKNLHKKLIHVITENPNINLITLIKALSPAEQSIVYNCAIIKKRINGNKKVGTIKGRDPWYLIFGFCKHYSAQHYYDNAKGDSFYSRLSKSQLDQVIKAATPKKRTK